MLVQGHDLAVNPHAMAFAGLGAAEVLRSYPDDTVATALLSDAAAAIGTPGPPSSWTWPQQRLTYANAALVEVVIAAGHLLGDPPTWATVCGC